MIKRTFEARVNLSSKLDEVSIKANLKIGRNGYISGKRRLVRTGRGKKVRYGLAHIPGSECQSTVLEALEGSANFQYAIKELMKQKGGYENVEFACECKSPGCLGYAPNRTPGGRNGRCYPASPISHEV